MRTSNQSRFVGAPAALAAALALATAADAQTDFSVTAIQVNQAIQSGTTPLTAGRSTVARASIGVAGINQKVDGLMRIFVGGVETADSPIFSANGPLQPVPGAPLAQLDGTLNFIFVPPASNDVVLTVEVNPAGPKFVNEIDYTNNSLSTASLSFQPRDMPELAYSPIDYQFGTVPNPNLPDPFLIEPGVGDNFLQGIFPGADWFYHRTDAPSKLWTASLSGSGSALISSLQADRLLMVPIPDYVYGWVPGGLPYNGQSTIGGPASMGNTQNFKHQRTFAHEIGHNHGLFHNSVTTQTVGFDVEHHLAVTELLPQIKPVGLNDIMVPGLNTNQAWVGQGNYSFFFNHSTFDPGSDASSMTSEPMLVVSGLWNKETGTFEPHDVVRVEAGGELSTPVPAAEANVFVRTYGGGVLLDELPLRVFSSLEEGGCSGESSVALGDRIVSLTASVPADGVDRLEVVDPAHGPNGVFALSRSANAPQVAFTSPATGLVTDGTITVSWQGSDPDGDALEYYLRYSSDGVRRSPLATGTTATSMELDLRSLPAFEDGVGFFEILASDGLNTSRAISAHLTAASTYDGGGGNAPWVEIMSPDNGDRARNGSTVILHSSGWDIEDRALTGSSIQWSSSIDGPLGSGRRLALANLSPGVHTITVTATDSDLNTTDDTTVLVITNRPPPVGTFCQIPLPFGGPGTGTMTMCGGDLSTGTTASLSVQNATPSAPGILLGGLNFNPQPFVGGMLVPTPPTISVPIATNASGGFSIPSIDGGGGPATLYLQYLYFDPAQPDQFSLTNAVQVDFLP